MLKAGKLTAVFIAAVSMMAIASSFNTNRAFAADNMGSATPDTTTTACTDGTDASNLSVTWNADASQIAIVVKGGLPICETVDVFYSAYSMPDDYDHTGFYIGNTTQVNPTAVGQTLQQSHAFQLAKGTFGTWLENVPQPDACYNSQVDLYYGAEITGINDDGLGYHADGSLASADASSPAGHGTQNIASQIFARDDTACAAPGMGAGAAVVGTTTAITSSAPTMLPSTGVDVSKAVFGGALALIAAAAGLMTLGIRTLRRNQ